VHRHVAGGDAGCSVASAFVVNYQGFALPGLALSCCQLYFSASAFEQSLFQSSGIACPISLRRSVASRRAEFLAGRLAARLAAENAGLALGQVGVGDCRQPLWPGGITGSITHDRQFAVAAIRRGRGGVGIDILPELDSVTTDLLWPQVIDARESALLLARLPGPREESLALVFSAKECLYKVLFPGVQRVFDFLDVELVEVDPAERCLDLRLKTALGGGTLPGQRYRVCWQGLSQGALAYCDIGA